MKFAIKWFRGFFEDQKGSASSKRAVLYIAMFYLWMIVKGALEGRIIDLNVLALVGGIILFSVGAVTSEFFKTDSK